MHTVWSPNLRKDILAIEGVQRRFTRLFPGMAGLSYEERLDRRGLYSLEFRRLRGDLIETYKILKGLDKLDAGRLFPMLGESRTRGHSLRVRGNSFRTEMSKNVLHPESCEVCGILCHRRQWRQIYWMYFKRELDLAHSGERNQGIWGENWNGVLILDDQP